MKRLLALLLLAVAPAFAQEYTPGPYIPASPPTGETENLIYTTLNPPPQGTNYTWSGFIVNNTSGGGLSGGNVPAYNSQTGTFIFGYAQGTVNYNLFDTSEFPGNGTQINSFKYSWEYFNQEFSRGTLSANIKFYDPNNNILENFNFQLGQTTNGWTLFDGEINFNDPYDISEIGRIQISFTGKDDRFWVGYYGPQVRSLDLSLTYAAAPPPTDFLYWERLAGENELFTLTEPGVVRYGADGVYIYQEFQAGTYACTNGDWGSDPIGGVVKSCSFGSNIPPPVAEVDCATDPTDPTCIIDSITSDAIDEEMLADTGFDSGSDDGSDAFTEDEEETVDDSVAEEVLVAEEIADEEMIDEDLEELLADEEAIDDDEEEVVETVAVAKTLENEEKASVLSDSISKDVLEAALSIAADVTTAGSVAGETTSTTASSSSSKTANETSETAVAEAASSSETANEEVALASNEGDASVELLETGRVLGQEALAATLAGTETSANESVAEAESVSATSADASMVASDSSSTATQSEETVAAEETQAQESTVVAEATETTTETVVAEATLQAEASAEMSFDVGKEMMAENADQTVTAEAQEAEALNIVAAAVASSEQKFDDESAKDAETTNALIDPALAVANTFNQPPSMMNLEIIGVLKPIEKSDAEVRAEQVVAANKEQQDAINANYMDADQSGIVAAIGAEADVSSYLSQRLQDVPFYKPEDIYKGVIIKDNVRGSYFLEKGNTDTYKKMVEEQYK